MLGGIELQVLNGMWEVGRCRDAANTMLQALEAGVYLSKTAKVHAFSEGRRVNSLRLDLHAHSVGAAQVRAAMWLLQLKETMQTGEGKAHRTVGFIPGQGHFKKQTGDGLQPRSVINEALQVRVVEQLGQIAHSAGVVEKINPSAGPRQTQDRFLGVVGCWLMTLSPPAVR